jgi:hypothetical protein
MRSGIGVRTDCLRREADTMPRLVAGDKTSSAEIYIDNRIRKTIHPFANATKVPHRFKWGIIGSYGFMRGGLKQCYI